MSAGSDISARHRPDAILSPDGGLDRARVTWRWFWPVLVLAFAARLAMGTWGGVPVHPDETYQYLEQAYRLVYGHGIVPWEYTAGIRSWLIPGALGGVLWLGRLLGLDAPHLYIPLVMSVLGLVSLALPVGMYRLTQIVAPERAAILAFLLGCFWHHFLYFAPKPMPGILAAYVLVWMVVLMLRPVTPMRLLWLGLLAGLCFTLRYQLMPVLGVLGLVVLWRLQLRAWPALLGAALALGMAGLLDLLTWGSFLSSFIDNFRINFSYDISSNFGTAPAEFYAKRFVVESGGLVLLALPGVLILWRPLWPVILAVMAGLAALHVPAHKEFRFVIWAMPFLLIAVAATAAHPRLPGGRAGMIAVVSWTLATTALFSARYAGAQPYRTEARHGAEIFRVLSRDEGLTGIDIRAPSLAWEWLPGYYGLGRPVPVFAGPVPRLLEPETRETRRGNLSHVVTEGETLPAPAFEFVGRFGPYLLFRSRSGGVDSGLEGIDLHLELPAILKQET